MDQTPRIPTDVALAEADRRAVERIERVRDRASAAATRLLEARPADAIMPTTALEFMDLVDTLAACPRKYGVFLTAADKRAIRLYHGLIRAVVAGEAKRAQEKRYRDLGITPVSGEFE